MNDSDLKPCPFCGGKGLLWPSYPSGWQVGCANDDCEVQCWVSSRKDEAAAAAVWNQRAALTPPEGYVLVSVEPTPGLLMSMAIRGDHALGCPGYYDQEMFKSGGHVSHQRTLEVAISEARKQHEEVVGAGFYSPDKEAGYAAMLAARPEVTP